MRLDIIGRFIPRYRPPPFPIPRRVDATFLKPQLEGLGDNHRPRSVGRRRDINDRHKLSGKGNTDLTEIG